MKLQILLVFVIFAGCGSVTESTFDGGFSDVGVQIDSDVGVDLGVVVDEACAGKAEYAECKAEKYVVSYLVPNVMPWESVYESLPDPSAISPRTSAAALVPGRCVRGVCCSGCVRGGVCVPVSPVNHRVLEPGTPNECGVGAVACVDCNASLTMRACQYQISGMPPSVTLTGGTCVD